MKKFFAAFLFIILSVPSVKAQTDSIGNAVQKEYSEALEQLLEVSGAKTTLSAQYPLVMQSMRNMMPDVPEELMLRLENKFRDFFFNDIINLYTPVYMRYLTLDEIKEFTAFYNSPIGRKVAMVMPTLSAELYSAGKQAGENMAREVLDELAKEGYLPKSM